MCEACSIVSRTQNALQKGRFDGEDGDDHGFQALEKSVVL